MPLVYTSGSGAVDDQFEHPTVNGTRLVVLQDVSGGTSLPAGEYSGEPLVWDGANWVPSNGIAVEFIGAVSLTENLTIAQLLDLTIIASGDVFFRGRAPEPECSTIVMDVNGLNLEARAPGTLALQVDGAPRVTSTAAGVTVIGPVVQVQDDTAVSFLRFDATTIEGASTIVTLSVAAGSGVAFSATGAEMGVGPGQSLGLSVNGSDRFRAFDNAATMSAAALSGSYFTVDDTGCTVHAGELLNIVLEVDEQTIVECNTTGVGFLGAAPVARQSITGALPQDQIDSIVSALVALGLATDDR